MWNVSFCVQIFGCNLIVILQLNKFSREILVFTSKYLVIKVLLYLKPMIFKVHEYYFCNNNLVTDCLFQWLIFIWIMTNLVSCKKLYLNLIFSIQYIFGYRLNVTVTNIYINSWLLFFGGKSILLNLIFRIQYILYQIVKKTNDKK